jgi:hypothetical protein
MRGNRPGCAMSAVRFIAEAKKELGYTEDPPGSNRTKFAQEAGHANGQPWCASFVVSIARRVGVTLPSESAYTPTMAAAFKAQGRLFDVPQPGDVAFFDFPDSKNRIQHVGIVESATATHVTCIEGNTSSSAAGSQDNGGGVYRRKRALAHARGFGRPIWQTISRIQEDDMPKLIRNKKTNHVYQMVSARELVHVPSADVAEVLDGPDWNERVTVLPGTHALFTDPRIKRIDP